MSTKERQQYQASLMELLGGRPVAYYPMLAHKLGGVKAAVMFCQLLYWNGNADVQKRDGWLYKSVEDMEKETGLTKVEQQTARGELAKLGVIECKLKGIPRVWYYRVNWEVFTAIVIGEESHSMDNPPNGGAGKSPNDGKETPPISGDNPSELNEHKTKPKTTEEITTEILSSWKNLFPKKPLPRVATVKDKVETRWKNQAFRDGWQLALETASQSPTLQNESWFDFAYFVKNDENFQKMINRWMDWKDREKYNGKPHGGAGLTATDFGYKNAARTQ